MITGALLTRLRNLIRPTVRNNRSGTTVAVSALNGDARKRVMVFGDSNAFRPDGNNMCWPALLEDKDSLRLNVINESYNGRTTCYDSDECHGLSIIGREIRRHAPLDYVIVMLGTNDVKKKYGPPGAAEIADSMLRIIEFIREDSGGAEPIFLTPPPMGEVVAGDLAGGHVRIPSVVAEYRLLARTRDIRLVDLHAILDADTDLESDMIHLNAVGRQKVADAVWDNLQLLHIPRLNSFPECAEHDDSFVHISSGGNRS